MDASNSICNFKLRLFLLRSILTLFVTSLIFQPGKTNGRKVLSVPLLLIFVCVSFFAFNGYNSIFLLSSIVDTKCIVGKFLAFVVRDTLLKEFASYWLSWFPTITHLTS